MTRKERTAHRRANRLCEQCAAGLQPEDAGFCLECDEIRADAREKYETANPRRANRRRKTPISDEKRAAINAKRAEQREIAKTTNKCTAPSCKADALEDSEHCQPHRDAHRKSSREWHRRNHGKGAALRAA